MALVAGVCPSPRLGPLRRLSDEREGSRPKRVSHLMHPDSLSSSFFSLFPSITKKKNGAKEGSKRDLVPRTNGNLDKRTNYNRPASRRLSN